MKKPRWHPDRCRVCGKKAKDGWHISATGLCIEHSVERFEANYHALKSHSGPEFQYWRRRIVASAGGVILDDVRSNP